MYGGSLGTPKKSTGFPILDGYQETTEGNLLYDFGNDSEGFFKLPFYDGEENLWKKVPFNKFANSLKGGLNIKFFDNGTPNTAGLTDTFIVIGANYDKGEVIFPSSYIDVPKIIHVVNLQSFGSECYLGYTDNDDVFNPFITSKAVEDYGVQSYLIMGGVEGIKPLTSKLLNPYDFFNNGQYLIQSANIKTESNPNTTDEFLKVPIFDSEERTFKFTNLPNLSEGLGCSNIRGYKEFVLRWNSTYNIPVRPKETTRIILHEGFSTQEISLALDNVNLDFNAYEGTEIEVFNFSTNLKTFLWGEPRTATNAFTIPASTVNNAVGVSSRFILLDTMWRKI